MKTKLLKLLAIALSVVTLLTLSVSFIGCGNEKESSSTGSDKQEEPPKVYYTVNFESNGGSEVASVQAEEGSAVEKPTDPTKAGYLFNGWYIDSALETLYDFSGAVTKNLTLYAAWADESMLSAKFYLNDGTETIFTTLYFEEDHRISKPSNPVWEGHEFVGWYSDAACTNEFKFTKKYSENQMVYAKWKTVYTFEAEYSYIENDKWGQGYSGQNSGLGLIMSEATASTENHTASNDYYVGWIYYEGAELVFTFDSDRDVDDVKLSFRLTAEYQDCVVSGDQIYIDINGTQQLNFEFSITGVYGTEEMSRKGRNDFKNYSVSGLASIKKGKNTIKFVINNSVQGVGATMNASAPLVDCMYISTAASLTLDLHTENIK